MVSQIDFPNSAVSNCLLASVGSVEKSSSYTKCYLNSAILFHTQTETQIAQLSVFSNGFREHVFSGSGKMANNPKHPKT